MLTPPEERASGNERQAGRLLTDQQAATPRKKRGFAAWKVIVPLLIVAALAAGAYFLFFNKSPEQKAAEADQEHYENLVEKCRKAIKRADSFEELEEAKQKFDAIEDLEIEHQRALPEVYCQLDNLMEYYDKMAEKKLQEYIDLAEEKMDDDDYRAAYDLLLEATNALPDNEDMKKRTDRVKRAMGYIYVTGMQFANCERDGTDIEPAGSTLHSDKMRYLYPKVIYNSLLPSGESNVKNEFYYKIFSPDGSLDCSSNSPSGYTNRGSFYVAPGERNQGEWLNGWGNATTSTYEAGNYTFELYYLGNKIYTTRFTIH